jgi:OOP family OmpA-OmpF porin
MRPWLLISLSCLVAGLAASQELRGVLFADADSARAAAEAVDAPLLAPTSFGRGAEAYANAETGLDRGRNLERITTQLEDATREFVAAAQAAEIAKITLASLIKTRADAAAATSQSFASELWQSAEDLFTAAARRLESGDIRGARARAEEAETLYRDAELTAIKAQYLSQTRALLAEAEQARVPRYAPRTLAKAQALLAEAEMELNENRYDSDLPRSLAQQANYEARHAIHLAEQIRGMRDADWSLEDVILAYEQPIVRVMAAADRVAMLDQGVEPAAEDLAQYIEQLRELDLQRQRDIEDQQRRIVELEEEIRDLDERLGGVSQERVALVQRLEAEARIRDQFSTIEGLFTRDEARVSREGNNLVLRLVGLTFPSGRADIEAMYRPLLSKVRQAADVFPRSQIVIEGHTDSYGGDEINMALSRRRAEAVSSFLTEELQLAAFRVSAVGYGETRPIASNETPQGRERNRRIDVRIEPQLE